MRRALLIAGPTASGKSALALALAERLDGVIINADALQVYRDLRVLTARPTASEEAQAPHRLYGVVDAAEAFSAGKWARAAMAEIAAALDAGRTPIVVGGTGLHFAALTHGLADVPDIPDAVRQAARAETARDCAAAHRRLASLDPHAAARIKPTDAVRVARALEVADATGMPLSVLHGATRPLLTQWRGLALAPPRADVYTAIERRFDAMLAAGAAEEARALWMRRLDPLLPAMKAHGMPWFVRLFDGVIDAATTRAGAIGDTRRYAKRQYTWMRHRMADWAVTTETTLTGRRAAAERLWTSEAA